MFGSAEPTGPNAEPVTVTVARVVRADRREAFEREADAVLRVAAEFPGNLGAHCCTPARTAPSTTSSTASRTTSRWPCGSTRGAPGVPGRMRGMVDTERYARVAGLDSFFTRPARPGPRWRLSLLTVAAVFAITSVMQQFVMPHLASWPLELRLLLSAVMVVAALGYVVMPALTRLFAGWLHPRRH